MSHTLIRPSCDLSFAELSGWDGKPTERRFGILIRSPGTLLRCFLRDPQIPHFVEEGRPLEPESCGGANRSTDNTVGLSEGRDDACPICIRQRTQKPARRLLVG